ncbi:hypothetical protein F5141DRAFT_1066753 [Pisolithus sp. B1]|nr:hypothetical protein F5141DRAFT_1068515 [Pisolithus sp. B1]KAI6098682.1 hypothetical protein F5141DRAFT_1066753 [Pisolithus sp. B1]
MNLPLETFQMQMGQSEEPDTSFPEKLCLSHVNHLLFDSELLLDPVFVWSMMYDFHIPMPRFDLHSYLQDIPIMRQAFPIRQERSKQHLLQSAVANVPHEVEQDDPAQAAELATPSMMSQLRPSTGSGACAPAPPSTASVVVAAPTETLQLEQADLAIRNVTASPVSVMAIEPHKSPQLQYPNLHD